MAPVPGREAGHGPDSEHPRPRKQRAAHLGQYLAESRRRAPSPGSHSWSTSGISRSCEVVRHAGAQCSHGSCLPSTLGRLPARGSERRSGRHSCRNALRVVHIWCEWGWARTLLHGGIRQGAFIDARVFIDPPSHVLARRQRRWNGGQGGLAAADSRARPCPDGGCISAGFHGDDLPLAPLDGARRACAGAGMPAAGTHPAKAQQRPLAFGRTCLPVSRRSRGACRQMTPFSRSQA
mmetsp:Transcript_86354/g.219963  ORF Transcript_86354/g.219963 Transcript_86354/m.219963 type:complete len:236 (+) Transcript_86354:616-1323(+)